MLARYALQNGTSFTFVGIQLVTVCLLVCGLILTGLRNTQTLRICFSFKKCFKKWNISSKSFEVLRMNFGEDLVKVGILDIV